MLAHQGYLDVFYYDESHRFGVPISLTPCVPYAWQIKGETIEIPTARSKNIKVAGFSPSRTNSPITVHKQVLIVKN